MASPTHRIKFQALAPHQPPEPYAEQYGVALAAETGNRAALSIIGCYYNQTGHYSTSENS